MAKDSNKHLRRRVRASYFISTASIALVLFLLGTVGYLVLNALSATNRLKESITLEVMLREEAPVTEIGKRLKTLPGVRTAEFVPKAAAAAEFKQYIGSDFEEFLGTNPLPDSYRVGMRAEASVKDSLAAFEKQVLRWEGVDEVVYQRTVAEQITSNIRRFLIVLLFFGGTFMVIAVVLLNNTIRAAIYSRRYIINTMKLVGATRWFILRPFMREGALQGLYAALVAGAMFVAMVAGLHEGLPDMTLVIEDTQLAVILAGMVVAGMLISLFFTALSVNKFVNMKTSRIHIY